MIERGIAARMHRRQLLKRSGAVAAVAALGGGALAPSAAHAATVAQWPIVANGFSGHLVFHKRLHVGGDGIGSGAWQLGGGVAGTAFGNPMLAFASGSSGLNFVRICDPALNLFQVYRSDKFRSDSAGPGGLFWQYDWSKESSTYTVAQYAWKATNATGQPWFDPQPSPWKLPVDSTPQENDKGRSWWKFQDNSYLHQSGIRDVAYSDEPGTGNRQVWGQVVGLTTTESFVGLTKTVRHKAADFQTWGPWSMADVTRYAKNYDDPFSFIRPLDTGFNRFQVFRGRDRRTDIFELTNGIYITGNVYRGGTVTEFDQGAQQQVSGNRWNTLFYNTD